jgi:WD40 repeat protein
MNRFLPPRRAAAAALCVLAGLGACEDGPTTPDTGSLEVVVNATGSDLDDRFTIQVNDGEPQPYTAGTPLVRAEMEPGTYTVRIGGVSTNCTPAAGSSVQVTVVAGERAQAAFNLTCAVRWLVVTQFSFQSANSELYRIDRTGANVVRLTNHPAADMSPAVSPDGTKIAFSSNRDGNMEIYVMNVDGSSPVRLTTLPTEERGPTWSPDGTRIAFVSQPAEGGDVVPRVMNANGSGVADVPGGALAMVPPMRWSPDGTRLIFTLQDSDLNVYSMLVASGARTKLTSNPLTDIYPSWTSDGRVVYTGVAPGTTAGVFTMNGDGTGSTLLFDVPGHLEGHPTISPDGRYLAYDTSLQGGGTIAVYTVPVTGGTPTNITPAFLAHEPSWQP